MKAADLKRCVEGALELMDSYPDSWPQDERSDFFISYLVGGVKVYDVALGQKISDAAGRPRISEPV